MARVKTHFNISRVTFVSENLILVSNINVKLLVTGENQLLTRHLPGVM